MLKLAGNFLFIVSDFHMGKVNKLHTLMSSGSRVMIVTLQRKKTAKTGPPTS